MRNLLVLAVSTAALAACSLPPPPPDTEDPAPGDAGTPDAGPTNHRATITISTPTDTARADVPFDLTVSDIESDTVTLKLQFRRQGAEAWEDAPLVGDDAKDGLQSSLAGVRHTVRWRSAKAPGKGNFLGLVVRAIAVDHAGESEPAVTDAFDLVNGVYLDRQRFATGAALTAGAAGDVDGDGDQDVVMGGDTGAILMLNDGSAGFSSTLSSQFPSPEAKVAHVALVDVDGDRDLDVVLGVSSASSGSRRNRLLLNDGHGTFSDATEGRLPDADDQTERVLAADVDADGDADLVFVNSGSQQDELLLNDGAGHFTDATATNLPADTLMGAGAALVDVDRNGSPDLVVANFITSQGWRLALNDGHGKFTDATAANLPAQRASGILMDVAAADVDKDGDVDLYFADTLTDGPLLLNDGTGHFTEGTAPTVGAGGVAAKWVDLNADGLPELFLSRTSAACVLLDNRGAGTFQTAPDWRFTDTAAIHRGVLAADFDGDLDPDLLVTTDAQGESSLWMNREKAP